MREKNYQQKLIKSESKVVFCNWDRGAGKTYSIAKKILEKYGNWVFVSSAPSNKTRIIKETMEEIFRNDDTYEFISDFTCSQNSIHMTFYRYLSRNPISIKVVEPKNFIPSLTIDYVVFDDEFDYDVFREAKTIRGLNQIIITSSEEIEYISDKEDIVNEDEWIDREINKLMKEFSDISSAENTTKRREIILSMIERLGKMKKPTIKENRDFFKELKKPNCTTSNYPINTVYCGGRVTGEIDKKNL